MTRKILVSLSGGMDSATVLALALNTVGNDASRVRALGFRYGSKHNPYEIAAAEKLAEHFNVNYAVIDLSTSVSPFLRSDLLMTGGPIPEGHYEAENMRSTVVPCRNMIFASILAGIAESNGLDEVWLGVHSGDHHIYPDCRPAFISSMSQAIFYGTDARVELKAPFLAQNKMFILRKGYELRVPYELTRTCYKNSPIACGKCGSCQERLEAFAAVRDLYPRDPIPYEGQTS